MTDTSTGLDPAMFAAVQGAREIGLIDCDFSAGRSQGLAGAPTFWNAAEEFKAMASALQRNGLITTNHSRLV
mgnify:CR=1 FL=1